MKRTFSFFFAFLIGFATAMAQTSYSVITVDTAHNHIKPGANKSVKYEVKGGKGIVVDVTGFDFSESTKYLDGKMPDKIFVVCEGGTFVTNLNIKGQTTLDKTTLTPYIGNSTFTKFQSGDTPIIAIGTIKLQGKQTKMAQVWATTLEVK
jgi:hypothetical protein